MKRTLCCLLVALIPGIAVAQIEWRISIKLFTGPTNQLPQLPFWATNSGHLRAFSNNVEWVNALLEATGRGYRWRLTEILTVPGSTMPLPTSTNSWFNLPVGGATQDDLDGKAKSNPAGFALRGDAINFYLSNETGGPSGGYCAFPGEDQHVILVAPNSFLDVLIHESGHFFGLSHTFDSESFLNADNSPCTNKCACAQIIGGDDGIVDTPLDTTCWNQDGIAQAAYGRVYTALSDAEKNFVNNSWSNIMSYHSPGNRFTSDQLDHMADQSNGPRFPVASGRTRFVDRNQILAVGNGSSSLPYATVAQGVQSAAAGDIVLIRPGNYNEPQTFTKPVTLRATRGWATLGVP